MGAEIMDVASAINHMEEREVVPHSQTHSGVKVHFGK